MGNLLLEGVDSLPDGVLADAEGLDAGLLDLLELAGAPDMRVRRVAGPELARARRRPAALRVVARTREAARARREDRRLARPDVRLRHEEHQLEALRDRTRHFFFQ